MENKPFTTQQVLNNISLMIQELKSDGIEENIEGGAGWVLRVLNKISLAGIENK